MNIKNTNIFLPALAIIFALSACGTKENERLRVENDSLRQELDTKQAMVGVMRNVKDLIDSIDASRHTLRLDLSDGMSYENFSTRLKDINDYVKKTAEKISTVEKQLKSSQTKVSAYQLMMDALKSELEIRIQEVASLETAVEEFKAQNAGLVKTVKLQQTEMAEMQNKIEAKQQELSLLEAKVTEMVSTFKVTEADAYYARAKAVEEAANKTRLAPRKKKETYKEAIELYKKALSLGKQEAKVNIDALEKRVH
jgi:chromosome segregation ATPase